MSKAAKTSELSRKWLAARLAAAVLAAFAASMALTWFLHASMTERDAYRLIDSTFRDVEGAIREAVDRRLVRQAMALRDKVREMSAQPWWNDPDVSSAKLREAAEELLVDEAVVADADGILTHSARREDVGRLDFKNAKGQAGEFASLLHDKTELAQPLQPDSLHGDLVKYVGVWRPEGGFVQVGGGAECVRRLSRTAITGLTHNRHASGEGGMIVITTPNGTIISHPDKARESGQWIEPGDEFYWERRNIEGFPVYVLIPKSVAVVERRVLVGTSALLNATALVLAAALAGLAIAAYIGSVARSRREKEMRTAKSIQESAVPRTFPAFPNDGRFDIYATMTTAKEVGGDFYDFFFTGPDKIVFLVADVSGKGVPAALFMMKAKTLLRGRLEPGGSLEDGVSAANDALCDGNGADMFVTAWIGEMDLRTGGVKFVNAGHNPPVAVSGGAARFVQSPPCLVLGAMQGVKYAAGSFHLDPGDVLYLYTDGVTEQTNRAKELFGEKRLLPAVEAAAVSDGSLRRFAETVYGETRRFAGQEEQADDITQLAIERLG